jgi:alkaline phosphatase
MPSKVSFRGLLLLAPVIAALPCGAGETNELPQVKNLILLIGDGMGPQQMGLLTAYAHQAPHTIYADRKTALEQAMDQGAIGLVRTAPPGVLVTDSAAAATQLASGVAAGAEMVGVDAAGDPVETILEKAQAAGKAVGLVTDTRLTHGTPAAFAAHRPHRSEENAIATDLVASGIDVLLGGGLRHWIPEQAGTEDSAAQDEIQHLTGGAYAFSSKRKDNRNLLLEARLDGYRLIFNREELSKVNSGKVLGLFGNESMSDALTKRSAGAMTAEPTLAEMTRRALQLLSQREAGFFLMVEAGQIDWACHNNDTGSLLAEMLQMDQSLKVILEWMQDRKDTLLVVTADHETGGFGFSYSGSNLPRPTRLKGNAFGDQPHQPDFNFGRPATLDRLYGQKESYFSIFRKFDALSKTEQTPARLAQLVNAALHFPITEAQAAAILRRGPNRLYVKDHRYLGSKEGPQINDYADFYVFGDNLRMNLLARALAADQNVVWATGTHTSTPVIAVAVGPEEARNAFGRMMHATDLGKQMQATLLGR